MNSILHRALRHRRSSLVWSDTAPIREELFGVERLERHAESLAAAQPVTDSPSRVLSLHARLTDNAACSSSDDLAQIGSAISGVSGSSLG